MKVNGREARARVEGASDSDSGRHGRHRCCCCCCCRGGHRPTHVRNGFLVFSGGLLEDAARALVAPALAASCRRAAVLPSWRCLQLWRHDGKERGQGRGAGGPGSLACIMSIVKTTITLRLQSNCKRLAADSSGGDFVEFGMPSVLLSPVRTDGLPAALQSSIGRHVFPHTLEASPSASSWSSERRAAKPRPIINPASLWLTVAATARRLRAPTSHIDISRDGS